MQSIGMMVRVKRIPRRLPDSRGILSGSAGDSQQHDAELPLPQHHEITMNKFLLTPLCCLMAIPGAPAFPI
jgi:hypothetical protein